MWTFEEHKIGDCIYLDASMFLVNPKNPARSHVGWQEGDIVKTKYGPQLICEVTAVRLKGLSVKIIDIDSSREGYYREWPEYLRVVNDDSLTDEEKYNKLLEILG